MKKFLRLFKNLFIKRPLKIIYKEEYFPSISLSDSDIYFDPYKFQKIKNLLLSERLITQKDIISPPLLTAAEILTAHSEAYFQKIRNPIEVGRILNLSYVNIWDEHILEYYRYISGGTLLGIKLAYQHNIPVINMGGGFHHAHYDRAEGFCLINDVAIAILHHKKRHKDLRYLVIDLDYHQSNGVMEYFMDNPDVMVISVHAEEWQTFDTPHLINKKVPSSIKGEEYLDLVASELNRSFEDFKPDMVIYLAGSDIAADDILGDMKINEHDMLRRDILVFNKVRSNNLPLLILSAGGYGKNSWKYYYNFIKWIILNS
ncbi:MAG: histone deacetylase [Calditrichia bacterium]